MIHYSCDRCGQRIAAQDEARYVVRIEVEAAVDVTDCDAFDEADRDHLMELHEILERPDEFVEPLGGSGVVERQRFDLCSDCHAKFLRNPVGREAIKQMDFSKN